MKEEIMRQKKNTFLGAIAGGIVLLLLTGATTAVATTYKTASAESYLTTPALSHLNQDTTQDTTRLIRLMYLSDSTISSNLGEVVLTASFLSEKRSPLRLATVNREIIERRSAGVTYPELVKDIPGVYATSESGSYGDARLNIRGFKQENISVMLNGIPISGLVTGNMFWNNWLGLSDATQAIQVQKGIGGSMLSDNSVGGTINIITTSPSAEPSVTTSLFYTSYGQGKSSLSLNSGALKGGWNISLMGSYAFGKGYVEHTDVSSWAYMLNISKRINERHSLLLTALGSPEKHEQRSARMSYEEFEKYGSKYNKNWGYMRPGEPYNLSKNFYHKPYITLHHFYRPSRRVELATSAYISSGNGGGRWSESKGRRIIDFIKDGQIDWRGAIAANRNPDGSSSSILSDYLAGHTQTGIKSNLTIEGKNGFSYVGGLHYQFYSTWEKERITDLLGGDFWYEDYQNKSLAGVAGRDPVKKTGDMIRTDNGKIISHMTVYAMTTYSKGGWEARAGASVMGSTNSRWDRYNYIDDIHSGTATALGYSVKGGALYKLSGRTSLYLNGAAYSRVPYSDIFFSSGNNTITENVKNERNFLAETGVRYLFDRGSFEATAYSALWKNKSILSDPYKQQMDDLPHKYVVQGLDALHYGIEADILYRPAGWAELRGFLSLGNWRWKNDVSAIIYDTYSGLEMGKINVYSDGLAVGDAPQTQVGASVLIKMGRKLELMADWKFNSRLYADFDPVSRRDPSDRENSYRMPDYHLLNATLSWRENIGKSKLTLYLSVNNLLNSTYIERGRDGRDHSADTFTGYWGFGINGNLGVRLAIF